MSKTVKNTSMITTSIRELRTLDDASHHFTWNWSYDSEFDEDSRTAEFTRYGIRKYVVSYNEDRTLSQVECIMQYPNWNMADSWDDCAGQPFNARLTSHEVYMYPTAAKGGNVEENKEPKEIPQQKLSAAIIEIIKRLYNGERLIVTAGEEVIHETYISGSEFYEYNYLLSDDPDIITSEDFRDYVAFHLKRYYSVYGEFIPQDLTYNLCDYVGESIV